jgi:ribonuclease T2
MAVSLSHRRLTLGGLLLALLAGAAALWSAATPPAPVAAPARAPTGTYVLALTWHPAFCEASAHLDECRNAEHAYTADHVALHGLWPQEGEYCGVADRLVAVDEANRWRDLPALDLSDRLAADLRRVMPGAAAALDRHEWLLHGTCAGVGVETYYTRAVALTDAVNASPVRDLFARNAGRHVTREQIRAAFDAAFGNGAGRKVRVDCVADGRRTLISELRVNLSGAVMGRTPLDDLLAGARNAGAGCAGGIVDRPGRQ